MTALSRPRSTASVMSEECGLETAPVRHMGWKGSDGSSKVMNSATHSGCCAAKSRWNWRCPLFRPAHVSRSGWRRGVVGRFGSPRCSVIVGRTGEIATGI